MADFEDHYSLGNLLGRGGAAEVYECFKKGQTDSGAKDVFVAKILKDESNGRVERFREEALFLKGLRHPNIVSLIDYFDAEKVMVLERASHSLQEALDYRTFKNPSSVQMYSTREKLRLLHQVASGMLELHERNIVHRDLCPSNILVDDNGTAKISDLGMSTVGAIRLPDDTLGNPKQYAPPEQATKLVNAGRPADVFAFGMLSYNFLTGSVAKGHPTPKVEDLDPEVPAEISQILHACISYDPSERPTSDEVETVLSQFGSNSTPALLRRGSLSRTSNLPSIFSDFFGVGELLDDVSYNTEKEIIRSDLHETLDFYGIAFRNLASQAVIDALKGCSSVRVLLPDHTDETTLQYLSEQLSKNKESLSDDIDQTINLLGEIREDVGKIHVRVTKLPPPWRMIVIDNRLLLQRLYGGDRERNYLLKVNDGRYLRRMSEFFDCTWSRFSEEIGLE